MTVKPDPELLTNYGRGYIPSLPDFQDEAFAFKATRFAAMPVPRKHFNTDQGEVRDQGATSSCVGQGTASAVDALVRIDQEWRDPDYSALFAYWGARKRQNWEKDDAGAYPRDAVKFIAEFGIPTDRCWSFRLPYVNRRPSATAFRRALGWKLGAFRKCETLDDVKAAISQRFPVIGGFTCFDSLFTRETNRTGRIPVPRAGEKNHGGHLVHWTGYDDDVNGVEIKNSWGLKWGGEGHRPGYGFLPYEMINPSYVSDVWALEREL